jgi:sortase (surface protein transpeptidase)
VRITIPSIDVSSVVQELGVNAAGEIAVPQPGPAYDLVGWYHFSPTPGELGPSIMVGHVDSATTGRSVFFSLGDVRRGDSILVTRADRSTARFTVTLVSRYAKADFPTVAVYGNTHRAALRLITCGGPIDESTGHYRDNVVVFANLAAST